MKASEARTQWKELLDRAVKGEVIKIERGGVEFYLGTSEGLYEGQKRVVDTAIDLGRHIEQHKKAERIVVPKGSVKNEPGKVTELEKEEWHEMELGKTYDVCKHNQIKGFCKKGCK